MRVTVTDPPDPIVSLDEARAHLRYEATDQDALISAYIAAATANLDGPDGWLGRSLGEQTLELLRDSFYEPATAWPTVACVPTAIPLPYGPIIEVTSVAYVDGAGDSQIMATDGYVLSSRGLSPAYGAAWPTPRRQADAVAITYTAGWPVTDDIWTGPAPIKAAILLMVTDLFRNRSAQVAAAAVQSIINPTVEALLAPYRIWSV